MTNMNSSPAPDIRSLRKQLLIAQGTAHRAGLMLARQRLATELRPSALTRNALGLLFGESKHAALESLGLDHLGQGKLALLLPWAVKAYGLLKRYKWARMGGVLVLAGLGASAGLRAWRKRRASAEAPEQAMPTADPEHLEAEQSGTAPVTSST